MMVKKSPINLKNLGYMFIINNSLCKLRVVGLGREKKKDEDT